VEKVVVPFGATDNIDTVPTSRFLIRSPFPTT
jgi:hypothetical protein